MDRLNFISLVMEDVEIGKVGEIDFEKLISDLELLAQQPPVEVHPCYENKEIDYEAGSRQIRVDLEFKEGLPNFTYMINDRASVKGNVDYTDFVGGRKFSQSEVDKLRR